MLTTAAAAVALALAAVGVFIVWTRFDSGRPSPGDQLARARSFADRATSVVYHQTIRVENYGGGPGTGIRPGSFTAAAVFPDKGRVVDDDFGQVSIFVGDFVYTVGAGEDPRRIEEFTFGKRVGGETGALFVRPQDVPAAIHAAHDPVVVDDVGGRTRIAARLDRARFVPDNIDDAQMLLTVAKRGRIVRLEVVTLGGGEQSSLTMEFRNWNLELEIPAPEDG